MVPSFFTYFLSLSSSFLNFLSFLSFIFLFLPSFFVYCFFTYFFLVLLPSSCYLFLLCSVLSSRSFHFAVCSVHPPVSSLSYILTGGRKAAPILLSQCDSLLFRERSMETLYSSASSSFHKAVKSRFAEIHNVLGMPSTPQCCYTLHK
jgi:hypothetical protein